MKISHDNANCLMKEYYYPDISSRNCIHVITFFCWFLLILVGTTIIGVGTVNSSLLYPFCTDGQSFCSQSILMNSTTQMHFYIKLTNFHQNTRQFLDFFSLKQMHGQVDNSKHCENYSTYGQLGATQTVGGYRVSSTQDAHPCGEVMKSIFNDAIYVVDNLGGTPNLDNGDLISDFNLNSHYLRLNQYQVSQWVDVTSSQFINHFITPTTSTKYVHMGKITVNAGTYQVVMKNNVQTQGLFSKELLVTEVSAFGVTNHVLGFTMFAYGKNFIISGILMLFVHIFVCFKWRK